MSCQQLARKRPAFMRIVSSLLCVVLFALVSRQVHSGENGILRIGGSTTLLPVISRVAAEFMTKYPYWSDAAMNLPNLKTRIFVSGGGSGAGIRSVINGTIEIGLASRNIKEIEKRLLGNHTAFLVGKDAVVIAANKNSALAKHVDNFSTMQLIEIFTGRARSTSDIIYSPTAQPIVAYVRDSGAGSAELFQKMIMRDNRIDPTAPQVSSQGRLLYRLETNNNAIGYLSSGLAFNSKKLKVFAVNGIIPTNQRVVTGEYPLTRPLLIIIKGANSKYSSNFIDYVLSEKGQNLMSSPGYVPIKKLINWRHKK